MGAIQVAQSTVATLEVYPPTLPLSAKVAIAKPGGVALVALSSASVDPTSTTIGSVSAGTAGQRLSVDSATGLAVGRKYVLGSQDGQDTTVEISEIDGTTIRITDPPMFTPQAGDTFKGLRVSFELSGAQTATRDLHYRAEWQITPETGNPITLQTIFHIVRMVFADPVTPAAVQRLLAFSFPSSASRYEPEAINNLAERASQMVIRQIEATGRFAHLFGDRDLFSEAGILALKLCLSDDGLTPNPGQIDQLDYVEQITRKLRDEVRLATRSASQWYDGDDDAVVGDRETGPWSTRIVL